MLNIKNICVDGYKNIHELNISLKKMNTLLSSNNYGKSNVLSAISFGFDFITAPISTKKAMMSSNGLIPYNTIDLGKNFRFEIVFDNQSVDFGNVKYGFEFSWKKGASELGEIIKEYMEIKSNKSQKYTTYIKRDKNSSKYMTSVNGRCDKEILINKDELIINKISAFDDLFYLDLVKEINNLKFYIDRHFDARYLYSDIPLIQKNCDNISPFDANSIARTLHFLKRSHKNKYELIINTLKDFFPYITDVKIKEVNLTEKNKDLHIDENIPFEIADYMYILFVTNKYMAKTIPFDLMSDGSKRILSLLTYMTLADINNIPLVGIEEPENSIHPGLLKKYVDVIDGFMDNAKVIITSHSPYLVNYVDLSNLYIGEPTCDGRASFKKITSSGINKINRYADDIGMQTGEYLFSVVSGNDEFDMELLKRYLENE